MGYALLRDFIEEFGLEIRRDYRNERGIGEILIFDFGIIPNNRIGNYRLRLVMGCWALNLISF